MNWKYGLIKINHDSLIDDSYCELVELYNADNPEEHNTFCRARIHSLSELESAYEDIFRDGINYWFARNGIFTFSDDDNFWNWTPNRYLDKVLNKQTIAKYEDEIDLYKVYGGD